MDAKVRTAVDDVVVVMRVLLFNAAIAGPTTVLQLIWSSISVGMVEGMINPVASGLMAGSLSCSHSTLINRQKGRNYKVKQLIQHLRFSTSNKPFVAAIQLSDDIFYVLWYL